MDYPTIGRHWREIFGTTVRRISLDPGFGCPNHDKGGCAFCDPATFAPSYGDPRPVEVQLKSAVNLQKTKGFEKFAAYFQPRTNTHAPLNELKKVWDIAAEPPEVVALCVGTRPDCVPDEVLDLLRSYRTRFAEIWLELGLQSAKDSTLAFIRRGHDSWAFADAAERAAARGLPVCAHVILGLPGENEEDEAATADFLAQTGVSGVKLHQLSILHGTHVHALYQRGGVTPLSGEEYARRAVNFIERLPRGTILHRTVGTTLGDGEVAPKLDKNRVSSLIDLGLNTLRKNVPV